MTQRISLLLFLAMLSSEAVTVDRIAVVVGKRVIKTSDIVRDLRITQFLNRQEPDLGLPARREAAERLIDQEIIRQELSISGYAQPMGAEPGAMLQELRRDRFAGSHERMRAELTRRGISEDQLRAQLRWQLTVLKFIDQRFRAGVLVTDEDVRSYYEQHVATAGNRSSGRNNFEAMESGIRESLEGERINEAFEGWLKEARERTRIEYRQGAFE